MSKTAEMRQATFSRGEATRERAPKLADSLAKQECAIEAEETLSDESKTIANVNLVSGRCIVIRNRQDSDCLEIISPAGQIEVSIDLTQDGPKVRLSGATLELESLDNLTLRAKNVELLAENAVRVRSDSMDVETASETSLYCENRTKVLSRETYLQASDEIGMNAGMIVTQGP